MAATATFPEEPSQPVGGLSTRLHTPTNVPVISSARHPTPRRSVRFCARQRRLVDAHCPPRTPLHDHGVTAFVRHSRHRSAGVTPPSSLVRAHAPDRHPPVGFGCPYSFGSLQVAASPCCMTAVPDVISAILVQSLGSLPRHDPAVLSSVSSRWTSASPSGQQNRLVK